MTYRPSTFEVPVGVLNGALSCKAKLLLIDAMQSAEKWFVLDPETNQGRMSPFDPVADLRRKHKLADRRAWQAVRSELERHGCCELVKGYDNGKHWSFMSWSWGHFWPEHDAFDVIDRADNPARWPVNRPSFGGGVQISLGNNISTYIEKNVHVAVSPCDEIEFQCEGLAEYENRRNLSPAFMAISRGLVPSPMPGGHGLCAHLAVYWQERAERLLAG